MKKRKICVVTTSRADFGLLAGLMKAIQADPALHLQVIAAGMHLSSAFGSTWKEIKDAGIKIDRKIAMRMTGRSGLENLNSIALGIEGFGPALSQLRPNILVLLGDRFELLAPATCALMLGIPIAHLHGGELSEGAVDDSVRHAVTKLASIHFPATEAYRLRILQMGEAPKSVFNLGAPGLDQIYGSKLLTRSQLERELQIKLNGRVALVTYHPVTRSQQSVVQQVRQLLAALRSCGLTAVITMANADAQGAIINRRLKAACAKNPEHLRWVPHLGHYRYLSCLKQVSLMVGNSSSGITEAASFRLPVVNIGDRQRGRVRAANVIDVQCDEAEITKGIQKALSHKFRASLRGLRNPYDRFRDGSTSDRIKEVLKSLPISNEFLKKQFHDLN